MSARPLVTLAQPAPRRALPSGPSPAELRGPARDVLARQPVVGNRAGQPLLPPAGRAAASGTWVGEADKLGGPVDRFVKMLGQEMPE
jgi:hypothetical protein